MCDIVQGQLILSHHQDDPWADALMDDIKINQVHHVHVLQELSERLEHAHVNCTLRWRVYLLQVPEGQESWKANLLHSLYTLKMRIAPSLSPWSGPASTSDTLLIVPNSVVSLASAIGLSSHHPVYKTSLGTLTATGAGVMVAVVDSGLQAGEPCARRIDLWSPHGTADDQVGHGTAMVEVIRDVAPACSVTAIKFTNSHTLSEWDALAGLHAARDAHVINLSWAFGLVHGTCTTCGRLSTSARSVVFENVLSDVLDQLHEPIVIAAAGSAAAKPVRYPALFSSVIAVGALDVNGSPARYSNYGASAADRGIHDNVYFAPGGDTNTPAGSAHWPLPAAAYFGTSVSAAYASGVVACARETFVRCRDQILADLRSAAIPIPNVANSQDYGNGKIQAC